jgi:hypothetical protein
MEFNSVFKGLMKLICIKELMPYKTLQLNLSEEDSNPWFILII